MYSSKYKADILLGPEMVMSNNILQHIVAVAHEGQINCVQDLVNQTSWNWNFIWKYRQHVVEVVLDSRPVAPTAPLTDVPSVPEHESNLPLQLSTRTNSFATASVKPPTM